MRPARLGLIMMAFLLSRIPWPPPVIAPKRALRSASPGLRNCPEMGNAKFAVGGALSGNKGENNTNIGGREMRFSVLALLLFVLTAASCGGTAGRETATTGPTATSVNTLPPTVVAPTATAVITVQAPTAQPPEASPTVISQTAIDAATAECQSLYPASTAVYAEPDNGCLVASQGGSNYFVDYGSREMTRSEFLKEKEELGKSILPILKKRGVNPCNVMWPMPFPKEEWQKGDMTTDGCSALFGPPPPGW